MKWLRKSPSEPLVVSMSGVKLGERVLVLGTSDHILLAGAGTRSGLTGRTCVVGESEPATTAAVAAAEEAGALVEGFPAQWSALPFDDGSFDVVLVRQILPVLAVTARSGCVAEIRRVLRPGGRVVVIDNLGGGLLGGLLGGSRPDATRFYEQEGGPVSLLEAHGFKAVRPLAEREGLIFTEGARPARV